MRLRAYPLTGRRLPPCKTMKEVELHAPDDWKEETLRDVEDTNPNPNPDHTQTKNELHYTSHQHLIVRKQHQANPVHNPTLALTLTLTPYPHLSPHPHIHLTPHSHRHPRPDVSIINIVHPNPDTDPNAYPNPNPTWVQDGDDELTLAFAGRQIIAML